MKVSEITVQNVADYLRLNDGDYDTTFISALISTAQKYISDYTGIPIASDIEKTLDDYEDFYIVVMVLCQDMYDNRQMYIDGKELNRLVSTILNMHCINLL